MGMFNAHKMENTISKRLRHLMEIKQISENELHRASGVSQSTINRLLHSRVSPTHKILNKIAVVLHVSTEALSINSDALALIITELSILDIADQTHCLNLIRKELLCPRETRKDKQHDHSIRHAHRKDDSRK